MSSVCCVVPQDRNGTWKYPPARCASEGEIILRFQENCIPLPPTPMKANAYVCYLGKLKTSLGSYLLVLEHHDTY